MTADTRSPLKPLVTFPWGLSDRSLTSPEPARGGRLKDTVYPTVASAGRPSRPEPTTSSVRSHQRIVDILAALDDHELVIIGFERATLAQDVADLIEAREGLAVERVARMSVFDRLADQTETR